MMMRHVQLNKLTLALSRIPPKSMALIIEHRPRDFKGTLKTINHYYNIEIFTIETDYP